MTSSPNDITQLLVDWGKGNKLALDGLMPLVYDELHRIWNMAKAWLYGEISDRGSN